MASNGIGSWLTTLLIAVSDPMKPSTVLLGYAVPLPMKPRANAVSISLRGQLL
jgi:hypothetical protein